MLQIHEKFGSQSLIQSNSSNNSKQVFKFETDIAEQPKNGSKKLKMQKAE